MKKSRVEIPNKRRTAERLCENDKIGLQLATLCGWEFDPYVPMDTGHLKDSWKTRVEPFKLTYDTVDPDYAKTMWNGKIKGRPISYSHAKHPLAGDHWEKRAKSKYPKIAKELSKYIKTL